MISYSLNLKKLKKLYINLIIYCMIKKNLMTNLPLFSYYILALILILLLLVLLGKYAKQYFWSRKQILSPRTISIVDVLDSILRVISNVDITEYKIKTLITKISNIIVSAKFGYCSKVPNIKYDHYIEKERAVYENEWLKEWICHTSNITKTYSVFLQVRHKFNLLLKIKQKNITESLLIYDALIKINEWIVSQSDHDVSIIIT